MRYQIFILIDDEPGQASEIKEMMFHLLGDRMIVPMELDVEESP